MAITTILLIPFLKTKGRGIVALSVVTIQIIAISFIGIFVFANGYAEFQYAGSTVTGIIPIRIDYLSAWFLLLISFTFLTGAWYGFQYMKKYRQKADDLALHIVAFLLVYIALVNICVIQNSLVFLVVWEFMALGSFILIIFEHHKAETLKAGINFLIQSHICVLFLTVSFLWVKVKTGSYDFQAITAYTSSQSAGTGIGLFIFFFIGYAIKSGFVPFHTWLPLAHPVAPAHISGIMSGVIIKIGIYGILRLLFLIKSDMISIGYFILFISVITGVYGVMLAIVQHNLKKLLAYHSIENIGIIGIGMGLGTLGLGYNIQIMVITGFGGALLHTLNHSLFKSLLFYCAGNIYQLKHTMNIEALGGLIKRIPHTAYLFLIGSLAICGLPPFNGFVSEFFIYSGLYQGLISNNFSLILFLLFSILGMVLIGGLALICFTKAFGIVFLGSPRDNSNLEQNSENRFKIAPLYIIAVIILIIGLFPILLSPSLAKIIHLFQPMLGSGTSAQIAKTFGNFSIIGLYSIGFILLTLFLYFLRKFLTKQRKNSINITWGCGYVGNSSKMQYSASSFIRTYRKLAEPILSIKREKKEAAGLYPNKVKHATHASDIIEIWLIDKPLFYIRRFLNRFMFLQNGNIQAYILYGFIFICIIILLPVLSEEVIVFIKFLNQL